MDRSLGLAEIFCSDVESQIFDCIDETAMATRVFLAMTCVKYYSSFQESIRQYRVGHRRYLLIWYELGCLGLVEGVRFLLATCCWTLSRRALGELFRGAFKYNQITFLATLYSVNPPIWPFSESYYGTSSHGLLGKALGEAGCESSIARFIGAPDAAECSFYGTIDVVSGLKHISSSISISSFFGGIFKSRRLELYRAYKHFLFSWPAGFLHHTRLDGQIYFKCIKHGAWDILTDLVNEGAVTFGWFDKTERSSEIMKPKQTSISDGIITSFVEWGRTDMSIIFQELYHITPPGLRGRHLEYFRRYAHVPSYWAFFLSLPGVRFSNYIGGIMGALKRNREGRHTLSPKEYLLRRLAVEFIHNKDLPVDDDIIVQALSEAKYAVFLTDCTSLIEFFNSLDALLDSTAVVPKFSSSVHKYGQGTVSGRLHAFGPLIEYFVDRDYTISAALMRDILASRLALSTKLRAFESYVAREVDGDSALATLMHVFLRYEFPPKGHFAGLVEVLVKQYRAPIDVERIWIALISVVRIIDWRLFMADAFFKDVLPAIEATLAQWTKRGSFIKEDYPDRSHYPPNIREEFLVSKAAKIPQIYSWVRQFFGSSPLTSGSHSVIDEERMTTDC